ncbi:MAG: twin-arginine translocation pathway signal protein, partial [Mycobacterium sp.]
ADLEHDHRRLAATLRAGWSLTSGPLAAPQAAEDALHQLLHAVSAVLLTGDSRPVTETAFWIVDLMATRGIDAAVIDELRTHAVVALADYPLSRDIVATHFAVGP